MDFLRSCYIEGLIFNFWTFWGATNRDMLLTETYSCSRLYKKNQLRVVPCQIDWFFHNLSQIWFEHKNNYILRILFLCNQLKYKKNVYISPSLHHNIQGGNWPSLAGIWTSDLKMYLTWNIQENILPYLA